MTPLVPSLKLTYSLIVLNGRKHGNNAQVAAAFGGL